MHFKSILYRIIWLHVLALTIAAVATPLATFFLLSLTANEFENQTLEAHAAAIGKYLSLDDSDHWQLDLPVDLKTFYTHQLNGFAYAIVDSKNKPLFSSLKGKALNFGDLAGEPEYFQHRMGTAIYYGASFPNTVRGHTIWIQMGQNLEHPDVIVDDIVARYLVRVAWFTIPIMLLLLATDILIVRRALKPVMHASAMAHAIDPGRMDLRLPTEDVPSEILPLVVTVNQALDRLEKGFRMQRDFTADAAHELRTPLAVLRMRIESLPDKVAVAELLPDIEIMTRIVNQLLEVAELEASVGELGETVDLYAICADVVSGLAPIAIAQKKDVALTGADSATFVKGNAMMLYQAVRNLAENALNHTPEGSTVEINLSDKCVIEIVDEGPGIPSSEQEFIFRRFWRGDRSRSQGAGLGLSIVARIVEAHNGKIAVTNRASGGTKFSMTFAPA